MSSGTSSWDSKIQVFLSEKFPEEDFSVEEYKYINKDSVRILKLTVAGTKYIPEDTISKWESDLESKYGLKKSRLKLIQTKSDPNDREQIMSELRNQWNADLTQYREDRELAIARQKEIEQLKGDIQRLKEGELPMLNLREDFVAYIKELKSVRFGELRNANLADTTTRRNPNADDQVMVVMFTWQDTLKEGVLADRKEMIRNSLKEKYNRTNVQFIDLNEPVILGQDTVPPEVEEETEEVENGNDGT